MTMPSRPDSNPLDRAAGLRGISRRIAAFAAADWVPHAELHAGIAELFRGAGLAPEDAEIAADVALYPITYMGRALDLWRLQPLIDTLDRMIAEERQLEANAAS